MRPDPFTYDDYRDILRRGLTGGYRFASFADLRGGSAMPSANRCLMRHDCDNDLIAAAAMAEIEAEEGVKTTYFLMLRSAMYNLLAPENLRLAKRIIGCGHWIGLHFDASVQVDNAGDDIAAEVDRQRDLLAHEVGAPIEVVSFHQPDGSVMSGQVRVNCINTYDARDMAGVYYTSDSNQAFRGGDPRDLFAHGEHKTIQILVHPEWWTVSSMPLAEKWAEMLRNNIGLMQKSLFEREKTYTRRHFVTIEMPVDKADV